MGRLGIIVPTHDRPASLRRTLRSVVAQLFASDDLLVVDNNSSPETATVCREFAPRVRCIREEQQGLSHARNASIAALSYVPDAVVTTEAPPERMARACLIGLPLHLVRTALADLIAWLRSRISGDGARAFAAETRLWFFTGFFRERCLTRR